MKNFPPQPRFSSKARISHRTSFISPSPSLPTAWFSFSSPLPAFQHSYPKQLLSYCFLGTSRPESCMTQSPYSSHPSPPVIESFKPFSSNLSRQLLQKHSLPFSTNCLFLPFRKAVTSSTKKLQLQRRITLSDLTPRVLQHNAQEQRHHVDSRRLEVMVWSGSATHPSNCPLRCCSNYPHYKRKIFLGKWECVAQAHTTGRQTRSKAFAESRTTATDP